MFELENKILKQIKEHITREEVILSIIHLLSEKTIDLPVADVIAKNNEILSVVSNKSGIYFFEVKRISTEATWAQLKEKWGIIAKTSPIVKKRWDSQQFNDVDFFPFYVGKSLDSLRDRISEHIFSTTSTGHLESTSALRIHQHYTHPDIAGIMKCFCFRVSSVEIEIEHELLPLIESKIRNKKNCISGRDRS